MTAIGDFFGRLFCFARFRLAIKTYTLLPMKINLADAVFKLERHIELLTSNNESLRKEALPVHKTAKGKSHRSQGISAANDLLVNAEGFVSATVTLTQRATELLSCGKVCKLKV